MPEFPDITVYIEKLKEIVLNKELRKISIINPFFVRTFAPPIQSIVNNKIKSIYRIGKRIVFDFDDELYVIIHLMISGRLQWRELSAAHNRKLDLAVFDFENGRLAVTEIATKKRASLHLIQGQHNLKAINPGGLEIFDISLEQFKQAITQENHTLKRTLTDPRILSGIGNAYSDEILHKARLSPVLQTQKMTDQQLEILYKTIPNVLKEWTDRLRKEAGANLPRKVTAFHKGMAVHGKFGKPCPDCGSKVQRIRYASNETNYCPTCQTNGKLLADRSLSRLLKSDWPKTPEELEEKLKF